MDKLYSFSIGDLASRAGVSVQAVRLYERRGLLKPAFRRANGYRAYVPESVLRLGFIRQAQSLGFSLAEIRVLLALGRGEWDPKLRARLEAKAQELGEKIGHLKLMQNRLQAILAAGSKGGRRGKNAND